MENNNLEWKEISRESVFKKYGRGIDKVIYELPDGSKADFYIKAEGPVVCMFALTLDGKVVLVQQFRPGPNKVLLELPGGYVGNGEPPQEAAKRELLEETGYTGVCQQIGVCFDDAYSNMKRYCFVFTECIKAQDSTPEKSESGEVALVTLDNFRSILRSGQSTDIEVGYLALDHLNLL